MLADDVGNATREAGSGIAAGSATEEDGGRCVDTGDCLSAIKPVSVVPAVLTLNKEAFWVFEVVTEFAVGDLDELEVLFGFDPFCGFVFKAIGVPALGRGAECLAQGWFG